MHLLALADDENFIRMVWALDSLQSGRVDAAKRFISYPAGAATSDMSSEFAIHKWELETLIGQLLLTKKVFRNKRKLVTLNCTKFETAVELINGIRKLEDIDSTLYLTSGADAFKEMHRIGHRQFPWQRGYLNKIQFYRNIFIFGVGECGDYFKDTYGVSINDFNAVGFALFAAFQQNPSISRSVDFGFLGLQDGALEAVLKLLSGPIALIAERARELEKGTRPSDGSFFPMAFLPSAIREFPIVEFKGGTSRIACPLPSLIIARITSGIYYDLVAGPSHLRNIAARQFELYSQELLRSCLPQLAVRGSFKFKERGTERDAPDIFIYQREILKIVIECKATKLAHKAQFSDDPVAEARRSYEEIAKAIVQLWRFYSANRRGVFAEMGVDDESASLVLTMDNWLQMSGDIKRDVISSAHRMADSDSRILPEDRRPVVFCSIEELERILLHTSDDAFLTALSAAARDPDFDGWLLSSIVRRLELEMDKPKAYPFDLEAVLPWWNIEELRERRLRAKRSTSHAAAPNT